MITPIFTIESGVVSGMLIKESSNGSPEILYSCTYPLPFQEALDIARLELAILSALDKTAEELAHKGLPTIPTLPLHAAAVAISAPWYSSENKSVSTKNKQPFKVKDSIIDDLVAQEIQYFQKEQQSQGALSVLESRVTDVKLNGYSTTEFRDKKVSTLQFCLYISTTANEFKQKVDDMIQKYFAKGIPSWHTMPLALFGALLSTEPKNLNFLIIEVGGELSEVMIIKNGILDNTVSFPYGVNSFLRKVASTLHSTSEINASLFKQYGEKTLNDEVRSRVEESLVILKNEWGGELGKALHKASEGLILPKVVRLKSEPDFKAIFQKAIQDEGFAQTALMEAPFEVTPIDHLKLIAFFINSFTKKKNK